MANKVTEVTEITEKLRVNKKTFKTVMLIHLVALILLFQIAHAYAQGTSTNFQGPKGIFYGIRFKGNYAAPVKWSIDSAQSAGSLKSFGTTLRFDPDEQNRGYPNIYGEMTSIYLPANTVGQIKPWIPPSWLNQMQYLQNPIDNYTWQIGDKYYGMEAWLCRWYIAFSAEWEGSITWLGDSLGEIPPAQVGIYENNFRDLELWLKIDLKPTFYYVNAEKTYFAIGKIQLSNPIQYAGVTNQQGGLFSSNKEQPRTTVSISPESESSLLYLYDAPWGEGSTPRTQYVYQGQALNPDVFKDAVYIKLDFNKFGVYSGTGVPGTMIGFWAKGDVAVVCLDVTVFSVGEWKVQDVQADPENYGRFVRTDTTPRDFLSWLSSPSTLAWLIPVAIFFALLIFAPWVILAFIAIIKAIFGGK